MVVIFCLDESDWNIGLVVEDVVCKLRLTARDEFATNNNATLGEVDFLANLRYDIPARPFHGRRDELRTDIAFGKVFLIHACRDAATPRELHLRTVGTVTPRKKSGPAIRHAPLNKSDDGCQNCGGKCNQSTAGKLTYIA